MFLCIFTGYLKEMQLHDYDTSIDDHRHILLLLFKSIVTYPYPLLLFIYIKQFHFFRIDNITLYHSNHF